MADRDELLAQGLAAAAKAAGMEMVRYDDGSILLVPEKDKYPLDCYYCGKTVGWVKTAEESKAITSVCGDCRATRGSGYE